MEKKKKNIKATGADNIRPSALPKRKPVRPVTARNKKTPAPKKPSAKKPAAKKKVGRGSLKHAAAQRAARSTSVRRGGFRIWHLFLIALVGSALFVGLFGVHYIFIRPVIPEDRVYVIGQGATVTSVGRDLGQGRMFRFLIKLQGDKVKAGMYDLPAGATVWRVARITAKGEVAATSIMIPEGLTVRQIINVLNLHEHLTGEITRIPEEGTLFPDTYRVAKGTNRQAVIDLMARRKEQIRQRLYVNADFSPPHPLTTWHEVITLASIVQKETSLAAEMPKVASVYLNRLRTRMRLQADPTVVYALTDRLGDMQQRRLFRGHLRIDSPYNTYRNHGLPPGPIANVGIDAIRAVLNPANTDYLFFVANGKGGHNFSRTLAEHNRYHNQWRAIRDSR